LTNQCDIRNNNVASKIDGLVLVARCSYQSVHAPAQAPQPYIDMFNESLPGDLYKQRRTFAGMVCVCASRWMASHAL
jgi:hypothetical protein